MKTVTGLAIVPASDTGTIKNVIGFSVATTGNIHFLDGYGKEITMAVVVGTEYMIPITRLYSTSTTCGTVWGRLFQEFLPYVVVAPTITGTLTEGQTLTCVPGSWLGSGTVTITYQWYQNGVALSGETASTYESADAGSIVCRVTATNAKGAVVKATAASTVV